MCDCYMMYTSASEASMAFGKLRSNLFFFVNRGVDEEGRALLFEESSNEKNLK